MHCIHSLPVVECLQYEQPKKIAGRQLESRQTKEPNFFQNQGDPSESLIRGRNEAFGAWLNQEGLEPEDGLAYQQRMRSEWEDWPGA